jgi:tyrosine-protein kinase Etk/Wzc
MIQKVDNSVFSSEQSNTFNLKEFLSQMLSKWYWFAVSIFIGVSIAWMINQYLVPNYKVESTIVVDESGKELSRINYFKDVQLNNEGLIQINNQNHIGKLMSYYMNKEALINLKWNVSWYQKMLLYNKDLYGDEPYKVNIIPNKTNIKDVPIFIEQLSGDEYKITVNSQSKKDNIDLPVKFIQKGRFGEPFENKYFGFILERSNNKLTSQPNLFFQFNDPENLISVYQSNLKVFTLVDQSNLIHLSLSGSNPQHVTDYLNELAKVYINYSLSEKNLVAENTIRFIDNQLAIITDSLSTSENKFTNFRTNNQVVDLAQKGGIVMQKQENLESDKAMLQMRVDYLHNLSNDMNDAKKMKKIVAPSVLGINDPTLNALVLKLSDQYSRREVLSFTINDKAPTLQVLDREIQLTHDILAENVNNLLSTAEFELSDLQKREGRFSYQLSLLPKTEQQFNTLRRKFDLNNELYTFLLKMRAESAINYASNQPDVKELDPARIENAILTSPIKILNYLVGIVLGIIIPLIIISLYDYLNDSIQTKDIVEKFTKIPILGMIVHNDYNRFLLLQENPRSKLAESFRLLRTNLKFMLSIEKKNIIAVQSIFSDEGKSFISLNLANVLAMSNLKVLLVDLDMRMPSLHKVFNSENKNGISSFLSDQTNFDEIVEPTTIENLSFVSSGPIPPNPSELLEKVSFEKFIFEARKQFDYIVLDNPPISIFADGIITGRHADINLFILRFRQSKKDQVKLIDDLGKKNALPKPGLVLNDATKNNFAYGTNYSDRNGRKYYEDSNVIKVKKAEKTAHVNTQSFNS